MAATVLEDSKRTKRPQNNAKNTSQHLIRTSAEFHVQPCSHIPEIKVLEDSVQGFSPQIGTESSHSTRQPHNLKGSRRYPPTVLTGNKEVLQQEKKGFYLSIYLSGPLLICKLFMTLEEKPNHIQRNSEYPLNIRLKEKKKKPNTVCLILRTEFRELLIHPIIIF